MGLFNKKNTENQFNKTKSSSHIEIDEEQKMWRIKSILKNSEVYSYDKLLNYELKTNGETQVKGGLSLGRAVVGGALVGGIGAIIGGLSGSKKNIEKVNLIEIALRLDGDIKTTKVIKIYKGGNIKTSSANAIIYFKRAEKDLDLLDFITQSAEKDSHKISNESVSAADEIVKFKKLLDDGIITQEEFNKKKKDLIG